MPVPYYKTGLGQLYWGDCVSLLKTFPSESIDLVITDPPYGIGKEGILNDHDLTAFRASLPELYRVMKKNSFFVTFNSVALLPHMFDSNPFTYKWQVIRYVNNGMVRGALGFSGSMSSLVFTKGNPTIKHPMLDIMSMSSSSKECALRSHPTEKPLPVMRYLVSRFAKDGDVVLDPFIGGGTTAVAAEQLGYKWVGMELSEDYCKAAVKRLRTEIITNADGVY
jgi:DNA modification methylase